MQLSKWFTIAFSVIRESDTVDSGGALTTATTTPSTFDGHKYATFGLSGGEQTISDKIEDQTDFKVLCPADTDVTPKDVINDGAVAYDVVTVLPRLTGNNPHLELLIRSRK